MILDTIARPPSLVEKVCQSLVIIARRDLQEDDGWLPTERELSAQLGVSRSVVREAAKRLELQGLLEIRQGSGMKVVDKLHKPLSSAVHMLVPDEKQRLVQLTEVRFALEPENARLAAERATTAELKQLKAAHERLKNSQDFETQVLADMEFHCLIAEASGNKITSLLIQSLSDLLQTSLSHGYRLVTKDQAVADHGKILDAILARNATAAATAMKSHLLHARDDLGLKKNHARR
jgi:GntR family transcriptional repressor for pyruvate dehydrogenase complex